MAAEKDELKGLNAQIDDFLKKGGKTKVITDAMFASSKNLTKSLSASKDVLGEILEKIEASTGAYSDLSSKVSNLAEAEKGIANTLAVKKLALQQNLKIEEAEAIVARNAFLKDILRAKLSEEEREVLLKRYDQLQKNLHIQEKEEELAERILEYNEERLKIEGQIKANMQVMKDIFTDSRAAAAVFVGQLIKGFDLSKELFAEARKEGMTIGQSFHEAGLAMSDAFTLTGTSAKESMEVMSGMRSEMGSLESVTQDARLEAASLARTFGIGNVEAGKLTAQFATMPGATMESANESLKFAGNLAKAADVAPGEVMKDIANSSEDVASFTKDGGKNIATAAVAAKKLGMEFGSLTKMADTLLDFESSVNKQMEASVLLGKEINLDKAREAALNGDLVGMTQEVLANVGGEAEFNKMNMAQRKALAESLGVSVQDLSKMVKHQDELANLTEEQQQALASGESSLDETLAHAGGLGSKLWEGTKTVGGMVVGFGEMSKGLKDAGQEAKSLFGGFGKFFAGMKGGGGLKGGLKGALGMDKVKEGGEEAAKKSDKVKGGGGFKNAMKGLADGFKQMAGGKVTQGIGNLALAAPTMVLAIAGIPFMAAVSMLGIPAGIGLQGLSEGLKGKGMGAALIGKGIANLALYGLASIVAVLGLPFMIGVALFGNLAGIGLKGLSKGLTAMAVVKPKDILMLGLLGIALIPAAYAFSLLKGVDVGSIIAFSIALPLLGLAAAGLGFLFPFIAAGAASLALLGVGMIAVAGGLMILQAAKGGLDVFESLTTLAAGAAGLGGVAIALLGIGAGLSFMAIAGIAAMPVLGALVALATMGPALSALGNMFGGGEEKSSEDDQMKTLIEEVRSLKTEMASITVNLDGKKVGDALRGSMNTSRVR
tara:strand:+ start:1476 stop:4139 length:2664 start_codon:yes stop_codon:yes gene_type:complete